MMYTLTQNRIIEMLLIYLRNEVPIDSYGQTGVLVIGQIFATVYQEEAKKLFPVQCYGGRLGQYHGFTIANINDKELRTKCYDAIHSNPRYKEAMKSY